MKISVIIPVYNAEKYLDKCINSIISQTYSNLEIILINDGSTDQSKEICDYYRKKDPRITLVNQENAGSSASRNKGFDLSSGEWVINVDSDDWIEPTMLEEMLQTALNTNSDIVASGMIKETKNYSEVILYPYGPTEEYLNRCKISILYSAFWNKLIKRDLYKRSGARCVEGIGMWDDVLVTSKLRFFSRKTTILNKALYHYRWMGQPSISSQNIGKYPSDEIKVAEILENEMNNLIQNGNILAKQLVNHAKICAKLSILTPYLESDKIWIEKSGKKGVRLWKSIFPELKKESNIYDCIDSITNKIKIWIAFYMPSDLASVIFLNIKRLILFINNTKKRDQTLLKSYDLKN